MLLILVPPFAFLREGGVAAAKRGTRALACKGAKALCRSPGFHLSPVASQGAGEEFIFPTWLLNKHPALVPNDGLPRDTLAYILSGRRMEAGKETMVMCFEESSLRLLICNWFEGNMK